MNRLRKMKGFTLIELIVVVIIIGILAAVAAVAYNKFVGDARESAVESDAAKLQTAINVAAADNEATATGFVAANMTTPDALLTAVNFTGAESIITIDSATQITVAEDAASDRYTCTITVGQSAEAPECVNVPTP